MEKLAIGAVSAPDAGFTVTLAACVFADIAVIVAVVGDETVEVETGKVAVV